MKSVILASISVSAIVGVVAVLDMAMGLIGQMGMGPFGGQMTLDFMFVIAAVLFGLMGWESMREQK